MGEACSSMMVLHSQQFRGGCCTLGGEAVGIEHMQEEMEVKDGELM